MVEDAELGVLGKVIDVVEDGGGELLDVACTGERDGSRLAVPFVKSFLLDVDVASGIIRVKLPAGLVETCVSTS